MNRRGFSLPEMLIAISVTALFFLGVFRLQAVINRTTELVNWKNESQSMVRKFYTSFLVPDINKASYPSTISGNDTIINGGADPTQAMKFQYLKAGTGTPGPDDPPNTSVVTMSEIGDGVTIMKWQINFPEIQVNNVAGDAKPAGTLNCEVVAFKKLGRRDNVLVYRRYGNIPEIHPVNDQVMVDNVEYVKISYNPRYTDAEILKMNTIPNTVTASNPNGINYAPEHPDYFHTWKNSGTVNIVVGMIQNKRVNVLLKGEHRYTVQEKISIKTNVEIVPSSSIE